ncbi:hypothetical protein Cgig2_021959 [Carnegiea gigantea]|uniref:RING-type domain-containing protein n=1 Tax=Carnegiea gigantea TaxID=171969 RepID=A0A9Q1KPF2_9CARY|nr:hypothetical protein Cgig2_021959 [Carnegiea gigantea]
MDYLFKNIQMRRRPVRSKRALRTPIKCQPYVIVHLQYKPSFFVASSTSFKILFPEGNVGVLTTPGPNGGAGSEVYVKLSYEPRWMTYFLGIGGMTSIMLWAFNFLNRIRRSNEDMLENQSRNVGPERAPLLPQKDDDLSSLGSSYDSGSQNGEDYQDFLEEGPCDERSGGEGGKKYHPRQLCVICYDAPKDCFFIPCGHCASCFKCGVRIAEVAGTCPICRRRMKKVRRIYNV